jgi:hypothetical protein
VISLDGDAIAEAALPGAFESAVLNVLVHEVAHAVPPQKIIYEPVDTPRARELQLVRMQRVWSTPDAEPGTQADCHDAKFIRRAIHLWIRATLAGWTVPLQRLFGSLYQSHEWVYLTLLLKEAVDVRQATFTQIEATSPPAGFVEQWQADLKFYAENFAS